MKPPYTLELELKNEELTHEKSFYPGAKRTGELELTYENDDLLETIKALRWLF